MSAASEIILDSKNIRESILDLLTNYGKRSENQIGHIIYLEISRMLGYHWRYLT